MKNGIAESKTQKMVVVREAGGGELQGIQSGWLAPTPQALRRWDDGIDTGQKAALP